MPSPRRMADLGALLLVAFVATTAGAQAPLTAASPREAVRTEIVAQVGAVRRLTVRPAPGAKASRGPAVQRAEVEVASNAGCLLVARGTGEVTVRLSLDDGRPVPVRAGERVVLRALSRGVHRVVVAAEGGAGTGGELPMTLELADPLTDPIAAAASLVPGGAGAIGSN